jgi:hypothetical protein
MPRTLGVEEEFHLVDLKTRRLTARAPERRALRRRGRLTDVVDQLIAETAGACPNTAVVAVDDPSLLFGYPVTASTSRPRTPPTTTTKPSTRPAGHGHATKRSCIPSRTWAW